MGKRVSVASMCSWRLAAVPIPVDWNDSWSKDWRTIRSEGDLKKVVASTPDGEKSFSGEYVLMAVSRRANTSGLERLMEQGLANDQIGRRSEEGRRQHARWGKEFQWRVCAHGG